MPDERVRIEIATAQHRVGDGPAQDRVGDGTAILWGMKKIPGGGKWIERMTQGKIILSGESAGVVIRGGP